MNIVLFKKICEVVVEIMLPFKKMCEVVVGVASLCMVKQFISISIFHKSHLTMFVYKTSTILHIKLYKFLYNPTSMGNNSTIKFGHN